MDTLLRQAFHGLHSADWNFFRGSAEELAPLLTVLSDLAGRNEDSVVDRAIYFEPEELICLTQAGAESECLFRHDPPVFSIGYTQSPAAVSDWLAEPLNHRHLHRSSTPNGVRLLGLLDALRQTTYLRQTNRILTSLQFEERSDLEYEPWYRSFMHAINELVSADLIQIRLRTPGEYWESRGECWNWPMADLTLAAPDLSARFVNELCRSGMVSCVNKLDHGDAQMQFPALPELKWVAYLPLKARASGLGVMALCYLHDIVPFPAEIKLLELLQRETTLFMDRTRNHLRMQRMATIDGLTNLFNHRFFRIQLRTEFQRALRYQKKMSLVMIDIDDFKGYNDRYGHLSGDRVLTEVAKTIRSTVRDIDFVARYGGEEFALILPEVDSNGGMVVAEKIRVAVEAQHFHAESGEDLGSITISCGVTDNVDTTGPNDLIRRADRALYWVKTHGRNLVRLAAPLEET